MHSTCGRVARIMHTTPLLNLLPPPDSKKIARSSQLLDNMPVPFHWQGPHWSEEWGANGRANNRVSQGNRLSKLESKEEAASGRSNKQAWNLLNLGAAVQDGNENVQLSAGDGSKGSCPSCTTVAL
ncbi:hypothetical protein ABBQ38_013055 [Trebouxia sp. C0009 RCD-2024]